MRLILLLPLLFSYLFSNSQKPVTNNYNTQIERVNNLEIKIDKQYVFLGNQTRTIQPKALNQFFSDFPDKTIRIQFCAIGSANHEMFSAANQIADILLNKGYNNLLLQLNTAFGVPMPDGIIYKYDTAVKVIVFEIPPID